MINRFYRRHGRAILLAALVAFPLLVYGARQAINSNENRVRDWLPPSFDETKRLDWFIERFGREEILVVSWPGCTLSDPKLEQLSAAIVSPAPVEDGRREQLFRQSYDGRQMLRRLTSKPLNLSETEALRRLEGWLVGPDHHTTCVLALIAPAGADRRHRAIDWVYECVERVHGLPRHDVHVAGSSVDSVAIDNVSFKSSRPLSYLCWAICIVIAVVALRSLRVALLIFATAIMSQFLSVSMLYVTGTPMSAVLMMVGSLVFVLSISGSVHLVNYYRDAIHEVGLEDAPRRAVHYAWWPCSLAAATTALGLISLTVSEIVPIFRFGVFASAGVLGALVLLLLIIPAGLDVWPQRGWLQRHPRKTQAIPDGGVWRRWAGFVIRRHRAITMLGFAILAIALAGVSRIRTTVNLHNLFSPDERIIQDYDWLQDHIGPLVPMEVVLRFPSGPPGEMIERMRLVRRVRDRIESVDHVGATITAATFGPEIPKVTNIRSSVEYERIKEELPKHRHDFIKSQYLYEDGKQELWRISVRVEARNNLDYGALLKDLESRVAPLLHRGGTSRAANVDAVFCGGVPLVNQAQHQLLSDLTLSFLTAFALVAAVMMLVLRSVTAGILAMVPNVLPSAVVFGVMGWLSLSVDIGAMMTASAALGIAVDDTLHFITWFRRGLEHGYDRKTAVLEAYERCGQAMTQTTLICGLGLMAYAFSPFVPTARFAVLMLCLLVAAILADVIQLPAILVGPLGRFFESTPAKDARPAAEVAAPTKTTTEARV